MLQSIAFVIIALLLAVLFRGNLLAPRSHGFSRYFAFLAISAIVLLRIPCWFCDPFAPHQLVSWALLLTSIGLLIAAVSALRSGGRPSDSRRDPGLIGLEKTTRLVTTGIYHYVRHPLYSALLFFTWGTFFKSPDGFGGILALAATFFLALTARAEEAEDIAYFGEEYVAYRERTKAFIPFLL